MKTRTFQTTDGGEYIQQIPETPEDHKELERQVAEGQAEALASFADYYDDDDEIDELLGHE